MFERSSKYSRSAIDEAEEHEELVVLAEGGGDDRQRVDHGDGYEHALAAQRVRYRAPRVRAHHHADEDYAVQPSLSTAQPY